MKRRPWEQIIAVGRQILDDIATGRFRSVPKTLSGGLNIISCPSCSRVENEAFIDLAHQVRDVTLYAREHAITIAVMGCRVNGPGETDDADLGMWCAPNFVNLKRGPEGPARQAGRTCQLSVTPAASAQRFTPDGSASHFARRDQRCRRTVAFGWLLSLGDS